MNNAKLKINSITIEELKDNLNLDCYTKEQLEKIYNLLNNNIKKNNKVLNAKGYKNIKLLKNYAMNKLISMELRTIGKIERALMYEEICESIYNRLPENLKW